MTLALPARIGDSWLARRDGRWRLVAFLMLAISAAAIRTPAGGAVLVGVALIGAMLGRVPAWNILARLGLLMLSVAPLLVVGQLLGPGGELVPLMLRVVALGLAGLTLASAAPLGETFTAARSLGFPRLLCEVGRAAERQATVLGAELRRTRVALRTRGFVVTTSWHSYRTLGHSLAGLLLRADARATRVSAAMRTRGYSGVTRATSPSRTSFGELLLIVGTLIGIGSAFWLDELTL